MAECNFIDETNVGNNTAKWGRDISDCNEIHCGSGHCHCVVCHSGQSHLKMVIKEEQADELNLEYNYRVALIQYSHTALSTMDMWTPSWWSLYIPVLFTMSVKVIVEFGLLCVRCRCMCELLDLIGFLCN